MERISFNSHNGLIVRIVGGPYQVKDVHFYPNKWYITEPLIKEEFDHIDIIKKDLLDPFIFKKRIINDDIWYYILEFLVQPKYKYKLFKIWFRY